MNLFPIECSDPELQERLERMSARDVGEPPELQPIFVLMDACDFYRVLEGWGSPRIQEIIRLLLPKDCGLPCGDGIKGLVIR